MLKKYLLSLSFLGWLLSGSSFAFEREIAITIDDLPFVGFANNNAALLKREEERFSSIMQALIDNNVPATGFVIAGIIEKGQWEWLERFQQAGFVVGNHTYSHINLNTTGAEKYIKNIEQADQILAPLMSSPKYFRYPFLAEGRGEKKQQVQDYLAANNYIIAPVTVDSKDFLFNSKLYSVSSRLRMQLLQRIKPKYLAYIWSQTLRAERIAQNRNQPAKQILLIHANLLNSYCMRDIIEMYKKNGYRFISLAEALNQSAPMVDVVKDINDSNEKPGTWMFDQTDEQPVR
ncbi:polysaccharide deacetylase family sporulation protein PdaB [Legionella massiliensis]|uniref:Polysaccharide deacetylase family sporulation protein PdaB n=1 Tax=Legionella massiliensis TaxID=1034943 RepID=A0A078KXH2_9GAMM|nr:polysaccharide deacetylase family protein [Legionella massiliensis]CDZ79110.1 polysaccharide deacetylase family sporulation protein PdaB [Legionella massiliensis]CEE14848.1 Polysaccharide deacetylase [Legionella massiliensis]